MKPREAAEQLVAQHNTRDPFAICKNEGILVLYHALGHTRGYLRRSNGASVVVINAALRPHEARFVCAHELGHWVFDRDENRVFMDYCTHMLPGRYETRADAFAAHLLLGQSMLCEGVSEQELAEMLNIPPGRLPARLAELGLLPEK